MKHLMACESYNREEVICYDTSATNIDKQFDPTCPRHEFAFVELQRNKHVRSYPLRLRYSLSPVCKKYP